MHSMHHPFSQSSKEACSSVTNVSFCSFCYRFKVNCNKILPPPSSSPQPPLSLKIQQDTVLCIPRPGGSSLTLFLIAYIQVVSKTLIFFCYAVPNDKEIPVIVYKAVSTFMYIQTYITHIHTFFALSTKKEIILKRQKSAITLPIIIHRLFYFHRLQGKKKKLLCVPKALG